MTQTAVLVRPRTWNEAKDVGNGLVRWGFRGQASSEWGLSSSLERAADAVDSPLRVLPNRENWMRVEFERRAHHYLGDLPSPARHLEWLSLMQHHGAPTRLVDFTRSFYVAAFFALESASEEAAVWAVNLDPLEAYANGQHGISMEGKDTIYDVWQRYVGVAESYVQQQAGPAYVLPVEPARLNERLSIQQGFFLMPCDISRTFLENLGVSLGVDVEAFEDAKEVDPGDVNVLTMKARGLVKIILRHEMQHEVLRDLRSMNISAATLFPGLDGFARSLSYHLHGQLTRSRLREAGMEP